MPTIRTAFKMKLHLEKAGEYERIHNPIWPELAEAIKRHGVSNYSIFLDEANGDLFAYLECEDEAQLASLADEPIVQQWWAGATPLMETNPDNSPVTWPLREVFHLD